MVSILPMVDLLGNTAVDWFCILSYFRLDTLSLSGISLGCLMVSTTTARFCQTFRYGRIWDVSEMKMLYATRCCCNICISFKNDEEIWHKKEFSRILHIMSYIQHELLGDWL